MCHAQHAHTCQMLYKSAPPNGPTLAKMKKEEMKKTPALPPLLLFLLPLFSPSSVPQRLLLLLLPLLLAASLPPGAAGVQVQSVRVPQPGVVGESARLECLWRAGSRGFYSVRWYKNDEQFYSYVPKNKPQMKVDHHLEGVSVELSQSNEHVVSLRELRLDSEGVYRCEVMSESPYFESSFASTNLTVVAMPAAPTITGLRPSYRVGETLNVTCTAHDARPPARITFTMNSEQLTAESGRVHKLEVEEGSRPGVYTSRAMLVRPLGSRMVPSLSLVCHAEVLSLVTKIEANVEVYGHSGSAPLSLLNTGCGPSPAFPALLLLLPPMLTCLTHLLLAAR